jgi:hypothetical protein
MMHRRRWAAFSETAQSEEQGVAHRDLLSRRTPIVRHIARSRWLKLCVLDRKASCGRCDRDRLKRPIKAASDEVTLVIEDDIHRPRRPSTVALFSCRLEIAGAGDQVLKVAIQQLIVNAFEANPARVTDVVGLVAEPSARQRDCDGPSLDPLFDKHLSCDQLPVTVCLPMRFASHPSDGSSSCRAKPQREASLCAACTTFGTSQLTPPHGPYPGPESQITVSFPAADGCPERNAAFRPIANRRAVSAY